MKLIFNGCVVQELDSGDEFVVQMNAGAPENERSYLVIRNLGNDCVEIMAYKSKDRPLMITEAEIENIHEENWREKLTIGGHSWRTNILL